MKKSIILVSAICLLTVCFIHRREQYPAVTVSSFSGPTILIQSKAEPLPLGVKRPQSMQEKPNTQNIPNVDLSRPVIMCEVPGALINN